MRNKIAVIGTFCIDVIIKGFDRNLVKPDNISFTDRTIIALGGNGCNVAIDLNLLGADVIVCGAVSEDIIGKIVKNCLFNCGIDVRLLKNIKKGNMSVSSILVDETGEKSITQYVGCNKEIALNSDDITNIASKTNWVVITGLGLMPFIDSNFIEISKVLHNSGCQIFVDTSANTNSLKEYIQEDYFKYVDYFLPNYREASDISQKENEYEIANYFEKLGCKNVIIKLGEKGCYYKTRDGDGYIDTIPLNAIDSTGAGDAFVAGFVYAISQGFDIVEAMNIANNVGGDCVKKIGSSSNIKKWNKYIKMQNNIT